jgi:SAM-dependent methyltransferase
MTLALGTPGAYGSRVPSGDMERFWDERARENALFYVDNKLVYHAPDVDFFWRQGERELDAMLDAVGVAVDDEDVVLDIGCGVGRLTRVLARRARQVVALDVASEMLERARRHNADLDNVTWVKGDGTSLRPVEDGSVDACVSYVVFQHIPDPAVQLGYVREMGRVLRPGGWGAFQVSNDAHLHRFRPELERLGARLRALAGRAPRRQNDPRWLGAAIDLDELAGVAAGAGLAVERVVNPGEQFCFVGVRRQP